MVCHSWVHENIQSQVESDWFEFPMTCEKECWDFGSFLKWGIPNSLRFSILKKWCSFGWFGVAHEPMEFSNLHETISASVPSGSQTWQCTGDAAMPRVLHDFPRFELYPTESFQEKCLFLQIHESSRCASSISEIPCENCVSENRL